MYRTRVESEIEPLWCREINSLDIPLFEIPSEISDSSSSPNHEYVGCDDEEAIIDVFLESKDTIYSNNSLSSSSCYFSYCAEILGCKSVMEPQSCSKVKR